jgi:hypothetical protein
VAKNISQLELFSIVQKTLQMKNQYLLFSLLFSLCLSVFHQTAQCAIHYPAGSPAHTAGFSYDRPANHTSGSQLAIAPKKKATKKWFKSLRKSFKKAKKEGEKNKAGQIILLLLLAAALAFVVSMLAFIILWSGSGSFVLPFIFLLLGHTGIAAWMNHFLKKVLPEETKGKRIFYAILLTLGGILAMVLFTRLFAG